MRRRLFSGDVNSAGPYVEVVAAVTRHLPVFSEDFVFSGQVEPYFEFEALVTAAVRTFDTLRFPLWKAFGGCGSTPNSFARVLDRITLPSELADLGRRSHALFLEAKEYCHCIQHYAHFGARLPFARVTLLPADLWSMSAKIPDNPSAKAYDLFTFDRDLDALSFGWEFASGTINALDQVVRALPMRSTAEQPGT